MDWEFAKRHVTNLVIPGLDLWLPSCFPQVEERKESYINSYDIVVVKDETMDVPNAVLNYITTGK